MMRVSPMLSAPIALLAQQALPLADVPLFATGSTRPDPIRRKLRQCRQQMAYRASWPKPGSGTRETERRRRQRILWGIHSFDPEYVSPAEHRRRHALA